MMFLPSRASFHTTFLNNCGRGESLESTACSRNVVEINKGMLPVKCFRLNKAFFALVEFHGDHKTAYKHEVNLATLSLGDTTELKIVMSVCAAFSKSLSILNANKVYDCLM